MEVDKTEEGIIPNEHLMKQLVTSPLQYFLWNKFQLPVP